MSVERTIASVLAAAGAEGQLHVVDIDDPGRDVAIGADGPLVLSSVFKVHLVLAMLRAADAGRDLQQRVRLGVDRTPGSPGLAMLADPVEISLRDLAALALTVSDVAAADALFDALGGEPALREPLAPLDLRATALHGCCRDLFASVARRARPAGQPRHAARSDPAAVARLARRGREPRRRARSCVSCSAVRRSDRGSPPASWSRAGGRRPRAGRCPGCATTSASWNATGAATPWRSASAPRRAPRLPPGDDALLGRVARLAVDALDHAG